VQFAAERHIILVPEIEMPGHAQAAITAYPALGNVSESLDVWTQWGVSKHIFNADENTILSFRTCSEKCSISSRLLYPCGWGRGTER